LSLRPVGKERKLMRRNNTTPHKRRKATKREKTHEQRQKRGGTKHTTATKGLSGRVANGKENEGMKALGHVKGGVTPGVTKGEGGGKGGKQLRLFGFTTVRILESGPSDISEIHRGLEVPTESQDQKRESEERGRISRGRVRKRGLTSARADFEMSGGGKNVRSLSGGG